MNSRKALKLLETRCRYFAQDDLELEETYEAAEAIKQDLDRLEELEKIIEVFKGEMQSSDDVYNSYFTNWVYTEDYELLK